MSGPIALLRGLLGRAARRSDGTELATPTTTAGDQQAAWDAHVEQAVALAELPLYDRIAHDLAADVDTEWHAAATHGWAAS